MASTIPLTPDQQRVADIVQTSVICISCSLAVAAYDFLVCWKLEYFRIWKQPFNFVSILYVISRYWFFVHMGLSTWLWSGHFTVEECSKLWRLIPATALVIELSGETILLMRTWAIWGRKSYILVVLLIMLATYLALMIYCTVDGLTSVPTFEERSWCIATSLPNNNISISYWCPALVFDMTVTVLMVAKVVPLLKNSPSKALLNMILREGLGYLAVLTIANGINTGLFASHFSQNAIVVPFSLLFTSIMSCRLVLSLRDPRIKEIPSIKTPTSFWHSGLMTRADQAMYPSNASSSTQGNSVPVELVEKIEDLEAQDRSSVNETEVDGESNSARV